MKKIGLFLAILLSVFSINAMAEVTTKDYGTYGVWKTYEVLDDGAWRNCIISSPLDGGTEVSMFTGYSTHTVDHSHPGESVLIHLRFYNQNWNHAVSTNPGVTDTIVIGQYSFNGNTSSPTNASVEMTFALDSNFASAIQSATLMTINYSSGVIHTVNLTGAGQAWTVMEQCNTSNR